MRTYVTVAIEEGQPRELGPGDMIGRIWTAALKVSDPIVSKGHAMVSLREGALKRVGLRGRLTVGGKQVSDVTLSLGLKVGLSPRTTLEILEVCVPPAMLAIEHADLGKKVLSGVASLLLKPRLTRIALSPIQ